MRCRFSFMILVVTVLCATVVLANNIPIPEYLGAFALVDSSLVELEPFEFEAQSSATELFPSRLPSLENSSIVLYGDYSPSAIRLNRVSSSHRTGEMAEESIKVRIKPQSGLQGLIGSMVLIEPRKELAPGYYVLSIAETENFWGFNLAATSPFFADPVYTIAEVDDQILAGTGNGLLVYSSAGTRYLEIPLAREKGADIKVGKIRFAVDGTFAESEGSRVVATLPLGGSGGGYIHFRLSDGKATIFSFPELKDLWDKVSVAKYYDIIYPSIDPEFPWFGVTAYGQEDDWEEKIGLFAVFKEQKTYFFGRIGSPTLEGPGPFNSSDVYAKNVGKRLYCFAEAVPETMFVGTDSEILRSVWVPKKNEWDGFSKIKDGPKDIVFFSRCVDGAVFAIDSQKVVNISHDTGVEWSISEKIASADKIDIAPDNNMILAYLLEGDLFMSEDGGGSFTPVAVDGQKVHDVKFADAGQGAVYVGTDLGLYLSEDVGKTWNLVGE